MTKGYLCMQTMRIKSADLNLDFGLTLKEQVNGAQVDFERRLTRMWRTGHLPHKVCAWLNLTSDAYCTEISLLNTKGVNLSPDNASDADRVIYAQKNLGTTKSLNADISRDFRFYFALSNAPTKHEVAALLEVPYHYLQHLSKENKNAMPKKEIIDLPVRDKELSDEYVLRINEYGIITKLSKKYNMSRKNVDLILARAGVKDVKPEKTTVTNEKHLEIVEIYKEMKLSAPNLNMHKITSAIASTNSMSSSQVLNILKKAGAYKPVENKTENISDRNIRMTSRYHDLIKTKNRADTVNTLMSEYKLSHRSVYRIIIDKLETK